MTTTLKGIAFPFQWGATSFPAVVEDAAAVTAELKGLVTTGRGERPMKPTIGVSAYDMVFETVTPIMRARLAADVARQIRDKVPRAQLRAVDVYGVEAQDGSVTVYVDIQYTVAGQAQEQQIVLPTGG